MNPAPRFRFIDAVTSDLTFQAEAPSPGELFEAAGEALLAATVENPGAVEARERRVLALEDCQIDLLLLRFLNELIFLRDADELLLRPERVDLRCEGTLRLRAELVGERLDPARHVLAGEPKATTAHGLKVASEPPGWVAEVTLDV